MLCDQSQRVVFWQVPLVDPADDPTTCHERRNRVRIQWEYGHAVGFALFTVAFLLLLIAHPSATVDRAVLGCDTGK